MKNSRRFAMSLLMLAAVLPLSGCVTERTVTRNGETVQQGLVVKRPFKEAAENAD